MSKLNHLADFLIILLSFLYLVNFFNASLGTVCQLWSTLRPDVPLPSRTGHHWTEIGFQGDDPATDFRGMGLLGLQNLV